MRSLQLKPRHVVSVCLLCLIVVGVLVFSSPQLSINANEAPGKSSAPATAKTEATGAVRELESRIDDAIQNSGFPMARRGISIMTLDGKIVYQRNADMLFTPASNMKIYTTAVALDFLGPDYRWRTSVYAAAPADLKGTVSGDLILYGRGAPDLVSQSKDASRPSLAALANQLYQRGVRTVEGNVIGDESYFRGNALGNGWQWTDLQWYYGAEASALTVNDNEIDVNLLPSSNNADPAIKISDTSGYVTVNNHLKRVDKVHRPTIGVHRDLSGNNIEVWGEFPPNAKGFGARLSVQKPALWAAKLFVTELKAQGIQVKGQATSRNSRMAPSQRFDPSKAIELGSVTSQPLSRIVAFTNKESINLYAELLLRTLGRERGELITEPQPPGRERGDDESGLKLIELWLRRADIQTETLALHDGSGLSRLNLVTPDSATRLLATFAQRSTAETFRQSLPISGRDGTLRGRLRSLEGRVSAKTGYITYSNSLSGYVTTASGQIMAFSLMSNDQTSRGDSTRLIDQIVTLISDFPSFEKEPPQKANKTSGFTRVGSRQTSFNWLL